MTYGISGTPAGLTITLAARTREELFRDAVSFALELAYGGTPPPGASDGETYPVQGAGRSVDEVLRTLVAECFEAARRADGTLHAPRWLALDEGRVTANLALTRPATPVVPVAPALHGAFSSSGAFPDYRATFVFARAAH